MEREPGFGYIVNKHRIYKLQCKNNIALYNGEFVRLDFELYAFKLLQSEYWIIKIKSSKWIDLTALFKKQNPGF